MKMDHLKTTIDSIRNLRKWVYFNKQFLPAVIEHKRRSNSQFSNLLQQLWATESFLCHPSSSNWEAHWPLLQELDCVVGRAIALVKEVCFKSKDSTSRREHDTGEHYLAIFLDLRWWTWVLICNTPLRTASHRERFLVTPKGVLDPSSSRLPRFMQILYLWWSSSDGYARHLPSYGIEVFVQETEGLSSLLVWLKTESGTLLDKWDITRDICSESAELFIIEVKLLVPVLHDRKPSWVGDELKVDLTQVFLGMSNSGLVIKCKDSGTEYALKRMQNLDQRQPVIARLSHPHIVQLISYWRENDFLFLMMELMEGDFKDLIRRRLRVKNSPFIMNVLLDILLQIAKAMLYLHDMGLTHPHLKSSDLLFKEAIDRSKLDKNDTKYLVKIGDFQFNSQNDFESMIQQNVYQFGLICLEVLSTEPLHWELEERVMGMSEEPNEQFKKIQNRHGYAIPRSLTQCITRCLAGKIKFSEVVIMLLLAQLQLLLKATKETSPRSLDSEYTLLAEHLGYTEIKPTFLGLQGRGGAGETLLVGQLNNDEDIKSIYVSVGILWIMVGVDVRIPNLYKSMGKYMECDLDSIIQRNKSKWWWWPWGGTGGFPALDAINLLLPVAKVMKYLHEIGVMHLDLKPKNILYTRVPGEGDLPEDVSVKLADFGEAQMAQDGVKGKVGTNGYMDPDMFMWPKKGSVNLVKADVFGFGMVFGEVLSGVPPKEALGCEELHPRIFYERIQNGEQPPLPKETPEFVKSIVESCLNLKPDERPSFDEICRELRNTELLLRNACT